MLSSEIFWLGPPSLPVPSSGNSKSPSNLQGSSNMSGEEENMSKDVEPSGVISVHIGIKRGVKVSYLTFTYSKKRFEEQVDPAEERAINQDDIIRLSKDAARRASCKIIPFKHFQPRTWFFFEEQKAQKIRKYPLDWRRNQQVVTILEDSAESKEQMRRSWRRRSRELGLESR